MLRRELEAWRRELKQDTLGDRDVDERSPRRSSGSRSGVRPGMYSISVVPVRHWSSGREQRGRRGGKRLMTAHGRPYIVRGGRTRYPHLRTKTSNIRRSLYRRFRTDTAPDHHVRPTWPRRPRRPPVHRTATQPGVAERHHRTPHRLDSSSRRGRNLSLRDNGRLLHPDRRLLDGLPHEGDARGAGRGVQAGVGRRLINLLMKVKMLYGLYG